MEARSHRIRIDQLVVVARARFPISHGAARTITCPAACGAGERIAHITSTPLLCACVRAALFQARTTTPLRSLVFVRARFEVVSFSVAGPGLCVRRVRTHAHDTDVSHSFCHPSASPSLCFASSVPSHTIIAAPAPCIFFLSSAPLLH
jgi:hypothetical protein